MSPSTTTGNKRALLIGINQYPNLEARHQLHGCVNDVQVMERILIDTFGFAAPNITVLLDEAATRQGIMAAMDRLISNASQDDVVALYYSGHGSEVTDTHGDEPSGMDSTIVTHDSGRPWLGTHQENRDILDDEIGGWLARLTQVTPYVTLIFDACHSAGLSRDAFGDTARWVEPDARSKEEIEKALGPLVDAAAIAAFSAGQRDLGEGGSGWLPVGQRYLMIAGCQQEESSYEYPIYESTGTFTQGALTYFLSKELTKAETGTTFRDVFERVSPLVTAAHRDQHPQIEGRQDRALFGTHDLQPLRFVPVVQAATGTITLGAGAAHGLTPGSRWAIYPQATKEVTGTTPRLGVVEITSVQPVTAAAKVVEAPQDGAIPVGSRAVEDAHAYGDMRLAVSITAPAGYENAVAALRAGIAQSSLLRLPEAGSPEAPADMRAYLLAPRTGVGAGDPVPQLGPVSRASWAVVGRDGQLVMPVHAVDEPDAIAILVDNCNKWSRYRNALALTNPALDNPLKGRIDFALLRQGPNGQWQEAVPDTGTGQTVYADGDYLAFAITNHYNAPLFISVLDFGLTGAISLLFPRGQSQEFKPETPVRIGVSDDDKTELYVPDGVAAEGGIETLKLFATTQQTDFSWLAQEATRSLEGGQGSTPLEQLFAFAYTGSGSRDPRPVTAPASDAWITLERTFFLKRKGL
jgi:hypothetical protein